MSAIEKMRGPAIGAFEKYVEEHDMGFSYECEDPEDYPRAWDAANRAALLAALDVEDEALLNAMAKQMAVDCLMPPKPGELDVRLTADVWSDYLSEARAALKALRSLAP